MFAAIDNTVTLPGYTRVDAGGLLRPDRAIVRLQANVENLFDKAYWLNADSNTNLTPGLSAHPAGCPDRGVLGRQVVASKRA